VTARGSCPSKVVTACVGLLSALTSLEVRVATLPSLAISSLDALTSLPAFFKVAS